MRDAERRLGVEDDRLRRYAAGPEHRQLVGAHFGWIARPRLVEVHDADQLRLADVHRRAVHARIARGDLDGADRVGGLERAHRDDELAAEAPGGRTVDIGAEHRHVRALLDVAKPQAFGAQRFLEAERAAEDESDEAGPPQIAQVGDLLGEHAIPENAIARQVGADVEVFAELAQSRVARRRHGEQRARLRIQLAELAELVGVFAGQDADVALDVSRRHAGGVAPELAFANGAADGPGIVHASNDSG